MDQFYLSNRISFLPKDQTDEYATRQVLSFLRIGESGPPSKRAWSIELLPESGPFGWDNLDIYDIDKKLLFRDKTITLTNNTKLRVRTAASDLLGSPVWSASVGPYLDIQTAIPKAIEVALKSSLVPTEGAQSLVCYSYPKLGLLCRSRDEKQEYVVDLGDFTIVSRQIANSVQSPEQLTCWSPYDLVTPATIGSIREGWKRNLGNLPPAPPSPSQLANAVAKAREGTQEQTVELHLHGQETPVYCAVATAEMILEYYEIQKTQTEIAQVMHTSATGTENPDQVNGYASLSGGALTATLQDKPAFETAQTEILDARPFKSGVPGHARAGAGFKVDGDQSWLYIYDPWPPNQGAGPYWENWNMPSLPHTNFICVKKTTFS